MQRLWYSFVRFLNNNYFTTKISLKRHLVFTLLITDLSFELET